MALTNGDTGEVAISSMGTLTTVRRDDFRDLENDLVDLTGMLVVPRARRPLDLRFTPSS